MERRFWYRFHLFNTSIKNRKRYLMIEIINTRLYENIENIILFIKYPDETIQYENSRIPLIRAKLSTYKLILNAFTLRNISDLKLKMKIFSMFFIVFVAFYYIFLVKGSTRVVCQARTYQSNIYTDSAQACLPCPPNIYSEDIDSGSCTASSTSSSSISLASISSPTSVSGK